jgi:Yip1-like protein
MTLVESAAPPPAALPLSPLERAARIFTSPARAWSGFEVAGRWQRWGFPLVVTLVLEVGLSWATYHRALLPDMFQRWDQAVANGQMPAEQLDNMTKFFSENWVAVATTLGSIVIVVPVVILLQALMVWFGAGFVLGARFKFSQGFGVVAWAGLVHLPASLVRYGYGWVQQSFEGLHLGLGVLLPEPDTPTKLHAGLTVFLDAISPFAAWYLAVVVLGTAALSGAPRRNVAWVLVTLYLAFVAFSAAVAALFSPGT